MDKVFVQIFDMFQPYINKHWSTRVSGAPRDFIDAYIDEIESTTDPTSSFHGQRGRHGLNCALADLLVAGIETTRDTLQWGCLLLASYPEVQEKLAAEILDKVGTDRQPSLADRRSMPWPHHHKSDA